MRKADHISALLVWTLLCTSFFWTIIVDTEHLPGGDFAGQFHAFGIFQVRQLAEGSLPIWSPGSYGGFPFAADIQSATFYPPRWVTAALCLRDGLSYHALETEAIAHIWLAGIFMYLFLYQASRSRAAALLGAVTFGLGGYLTSYPLLQLAILETITWLPVALLFVRLGTDSSRPLRWMAVAGFALGVAITAGHPQTAMHVAYLVAAYLAFRGLRAGWSWSGLLCCGAVLGAVALGISAPAWLPALRYMRYTTRGSVDYAFVSNGLPLTDWLQALLPGTLTKWSPQYCGLSAAALALFAVLARKSQVAEQHYEITFWAVAAALAGWLALGDEGILFQLAYYVLPGFSLFRQQERLAGLVAFCLSVLAGHGLAIWNERGKGQSGTILRTAGLLTACLALSSMYLALLPSGSVGNAWQATLLRQVAVGLGVFALLAVTLRHRRLGATLLILLSAAELYVATYQGMERQAGPGLEFWPPIPELEAIAAADAPARVDTTNFLHANTGEIYGVEDVSGISPLKPARLDALRRRLPRERFWQLLNVASVISPEPLSGARLTKVGEIPAGTYPNQIAAATVHLFEGALPRAHLVYEALCVEDEEQALDMLASASFDPTAQVVLQGSCSALVADKPQSPSQILCKRPSAKELKIELTTDAAGFLVISEWFYPGWRATLDGQPIAILPANYAFQALMIPAGHHTVALTYTAPDVWAGIALACLALLGAGCSWLIRWKPSLRVAKTVPPSATAGAGVASARTGSRWWLPMAIVILAYCLRLPGASEQELRGDEAYAYQMASASAEEILPAQILVGEPHSPLPYYLLHYWMDLAGTSELALRFPSILAGTLAIALLYQVGRASWGERAAIVAASLAAVSQSLVWLTQDARTQYGLALVAALGATLVLERALRRPRLRYWAAYAGLVALTAYSHLYGLFAILAHGLALLTNAQARRYLRPWFASVAVAAALYLPWMMASLPHVLATGQLGEIINASLAEYLVQVGTWVITGSGLARPIARWILVGTLGAIGLLLEPTQEKERFWLASCAWWLGIATLAIYFVRLRRSMFNAFYLSLAAPALWLLVGGAISYGSRAAQRWRKWLAALLGVGLLGANLLSLHAYYSDPALSRTLGYRAASDYVRAHTEPGDVFIFDWPDPGWAYYMKDIPIPRKMIPTSPGLSQEQVASAIEQEAIQSERIWLVQYQGPGWDESRAMLHWLEHNALLECKATFGSLSLYAFRPGHATGKVLAPLEAQVDGLFRARGYYVTVDGVPATAEEVLRLRSGDELQVTVEWEALSTMEESYTVFVHLLSDSAGLLAQHDGIPVFGTRPTWVWQPGEHILDRHDIRVPNAPGQSGLLVLGVYNSETLERQSISQGTEVAVLAKVVLE